MTPARGGPSVARMTAVLLVGHDGTERGDDALALARALAPALGARLVVANVLETSLNPLQEPARRSHDRGTRRLEAVAAQLTDPDEIRLVEAVTAGRGLLELAVELGAALIVVGSSHRGVVGRAVLGSTADGLFAHAPCGVVMAVRGTAGDAPQIRRIAVAYDGSAEAHVALDRAAALAQALGAVVDVVCAVDLTSAVAQPGLMIVAPHVLEEDRRRGMARAEEGRALLAPAVRGQVSVPAGLPGEAIARAAGDLGSDLVVCGSRGHGPVRRTLLGSTGRQLLHSASCAVLIVPRAGDRAPATAG